MLLDNQRSLLVPLPRPLQRLHRIQWGAVERLAIALFTGGDEAQLDAPICFVVGAVGVICKWVMRTKAPRLDEIV